MPRYEFLFGLLAAILSGLFIATLVLFLPYGLLTLVLALFDPKLGMLKVVPAWVVFSPWYLLAILISVANVRLMILDYVGKNAVRSGLRAKTRKFAGDDSGKDNINGFPGKMFVEVMRAHLTRLDASLVIDKPIAEDYGWGFWIARNPQAPPLWVAVSYCDREDEESDGEDEYIISVNDEAPILPWRRLVHVPDRNLQETLQRSLAECLTENGIQFTVEEDR